MTNSLGSILLLIFAGLLLWFLWEKAKRKTRLMAGGLHTDISLPFEQEFELYHNDLSLCSKKVRVCLAELGVDYKPHHIDLVETGSYETLSRHYLKINPSGIVPTLVHKGHPVYESHDILRYIADYAENNIEGAPSLIPAAVADRNVVELWVNRASMGDDPLAEIEQSAAGAVAGLTIPLFCAGMQNIAVTKVFEGLLFHRVRFRALAFLMFKLFGLKNLHSMKPVLAILDSARHNMGLHLDALEDHLSPESDWIAGQYFTLADVSWLVIFERLREADWEDFFLGEQRRPNTLAYWRRLQQRASYQQAITEFIHPTVDVATKMIIAEKKRNPSLRELLEPSNSDRAS